MKQLTIMDTWTDTWLTRCGHAALHAAALHAAALHAAALHDALHVALGMEHAAEQDDRTCRC